MSLEVALGISLGISLEMALHGNQPENGLGMALELRIAGWTRLLQEPV